MARKSVSLLCSSLDAVKLAVSSPGEMIRSPLLSFCEAADARLAFACMASNEPAWALASPFSEGPYMPGPAILRPLAARDCR